ncbi:MAG: hypothetical protein AAGA66_04110 [Bacteroidota bacterium]
MMRSFRERTSFLFLIKTYAGLVKSMMVLCMFCFLSFSTYSAELNERADSLASMSGESKQLRSFEAFDDLLESQNYWMETDRLSPDAYSDTLITGRMVKYRERAKTLFDKVREARKLVEYLDEQTLLELPVGINKTIGNVAYTIVIDSALLLPDGAELVAYMDFRLPSGKSLTFRGSGIKFSSKGGIDPQARLDLIGDHPISHGEKTLFVFKGEGNTYVEFDCDGFKSMGIDMNVIFSRDLMVPDTPDGKPGEGRVESRLQTELTDWNNFLVELDLPDFQVTGLTGVGFSVNGAVLDYSDIKNSTASPIPPSYLEKISMGGEMANLWRGFYLRELEVALPPHFQRKEGNAQGNARTRFRANDLIIDENGFTGNLEAENLIPLEEGHVERWAFSLDHFYLDFEFSQLIRGGFEGDIVLPITKESQAFDYTATLNIGDEYLLTVANRDTLSFPVFGASDVELFPNSSVAMRFADQKFLPKANLYGTMDIKAPLGKKEVSLADIRFENLQVQTVGRYLSADYFSFGSEAASQAMAGFPVQIENIAFREVETDSTQSAIDFDLLVNVSESFSGSSSLSVIGKMSEETLVRWELDKIEVHEVSLEVKTGTIDFSGSLTFYKNDEQYGDGFNGKVEATIIPINLNVKASAIFGSVDGFRYWYVDAAVLLTGGEGTGNGAPVPAFTIDGFAGGAYNRMGLVREGGSELGQTQSGMIYAPRKEYGLGFKASIQFSVSGKNAFNGEAALEMAFFHGGGLRYISFKGNGYFMTPPATDALAKIKEKAKKVADKVASLEEKLGKVPGAGLLCSNEEKDQTLEEIYGQVGKAADAKGAISAHVFVELDFENSTFYGNLEVYVNVANGIITGVGENDRAGWAELYFGPDDWYVYIGTPSDRIGLELGVGPVKATTGSYFMLGTSIPGSPPPPPQVSEILGGIDLDYMGDLNELGNGAGVAFGSSFSIDTGDLTFAIFFARFQAGAGFDIMMKNYGEVQCAGRTGSLGVNGWYANGQAYGYFDGSIGIKVKVFGKKKKIDILSIAAAAVLQAKLPNPVWMQGTVGGRFSILGGLVKGNCRFQVTIGEECEITNQSIVETIQVIADVTPEEGAADVSVFVTPQTVFNMPVEQVFEMVDVDDKLKKFRIKLDYFQLLHKEKVLPGETTFNFDHDVIAFNAFDVLPPEEKLKARVQVSFEEAGSQGWQAVIVDGKKYVETKEVTFQSGEAPDYIPMANVAYSYPVVNQLNFHKDEHPDGYIKLKQGQPYLFASDERWEQKGRITSLSGGEPIPFDLAYAADQREITFGLPDELVPGEIHAFELVNIPVGAEGSVDENIVVDSTRVLGTDDVKIVSREAEGTIESLQEKSLFETHFRTSIHPTFESKIKAQNITRTSREIAFLWEGLYLNNDISADELFAREELGGSRFTNDQPMVKLSAVLEGNSYYEQLIHPLIYEGYPLDGDIELSNREVDSLGVVPVNAVKFLQSGNELQLEPQHISTNVFSFPSASLRSLYLLSPYMYFDFKDLQAQVVQRYINAPDVSERLNRLIWGQFPIQSEGAYKIKATYTLPGQDQPTSETVITTQYLQEK